MQLLNRLFSYLIGPAAIGLAIAISILILSPDRYKLPMLIQPSPVADSISNNSSLKALGPVSYADAVSRASPSVVNIYTLREQPAIGNRFDPLRGQFNQTESRITPSTGSGVIVSEEGYIVTNLHVVEWAKDIRVALQDGREATPQIVGFSEDDDMAVLKIELDNLYPIEIGTPDKARVGDVVLAIGNPFGVGQTVTQGIISGKHRKGLRIAHFENFIQTDAAINPGNSGGALVDAYGRLLGINIGDLRQTNYGDASGIGFAIPVDRAIKAMLDIVEHGEVVRGWLGVSALDLNPQIVQALKLESQDGVLITNIYLNGPADTAGLVAGDIVVSINNTPTPNMSAAIQDFANLLPGDLISIEVIRRDKRLQLEAVLTAEPSK